MTFFDFCQNLVKIKECKMQFNLEQRIFIRFYRKTLKFHEFVLLFKINPKNFVVCLFPRKKCKNQFWFYFYFFFTPPPSITLCSLLLGDCLIIGRNEMTITSIKKNQVPKILGNCTYTVYGGGRGVTSLLTTK